MLQTPAAVGVPNRTQADDRFTPGGRPGAGSHTTGTPLVMGVKKSVLLTGTPTVRLLAAVEALNREKQVESW